MYSLLNLISFIASLFFLYLILFNNPKAKLNILFTIVVSTVAIWSFIEFQYNNTQVVEKFLFWKSLDFFWYATIFTLLHFILEFTKSKLIKKKWFLISNYTIMLLLIMYHILFIQPHNASFDNNILNPVYKPEIKWLYDINVILMLIIALLSCIKLSHFLFISDKKYRRQIILILGAVLIPIISSIIIELFCNIIFKLKLSISATNFFTITCIIIGYSLYQKNAFSLTPTYIVNDLLTIIDEGIIITDDNFKIFYINDITSNLLNASKETLLNNNLTNFITTNEIYTGKTIEHIINTPGKETKTIQISRSNINKKDDNYGYLFTLKDITDSVILKNTLNSVLKLSKQSVILSGDELLTMALQKIIQFTNSSKGFLVFIDNSKSKSMDLQNIYQAGTQLPDLNLLELLHDSSFEEIIRDKCIITKNIYHDHIQLKRVNNKVINVNLLVYPIITSNEVKAIIGILNNYDSYPKIDIDILSIISQNIWSILERKRVEDSLRESKLFLNKIIENLPSMVYVKDAQSFKYIRVNRSFELITNKSRFDIIDKTDYELFDPQQAELYREQDIKVVETNTISYIPDEVYEGYNLSITKIPIPDSKGNVKLILGIGVDDTLQKQLEEDLIKAKIDAEVTSKAKSNFLANMSHEIRTPLHSIIGYIDLALEAQTLPVEISDYLDKVKTSSYSLLDIVNDILDISKIESQKLVLEKSEFYLPALVNNVIDMFMNQAKTKDLYLHTEIDPNIFHCFTGDQLRIKQILINLISNAIKFTNTGGITVAIAKDSSGFLLFKVKDTGIGIAPELQNKIFQAFNQADSSITKKYGGTGLGTTISKQLVEMMDGQIWIEANQEVGVTFCFTIKVEAKENCDAKGTSKCKRFNTKSVNELKSKHTQKNLKVLIAEDLEINLELLKTRLTSQGFYVKTASNGQEAISLWEQYDFDVILMDINMPVMDGIAATKAIRKLEKEKNIEKSIPIIALTAGIMVDEKNTYYQAGMDHIVGKPINFQKLFQLFDEVIPVNEEQEEDSVSPDTKENDEALSNNDYQKYPGINFEQGIQRWQDLPLYIDMLTLFIDTNHNTISEIKTHYEQKNIDAIHSILHKIQGTSGNLELPDIRSITVELKKRLQNNNLENFDTYVTKMEKAFQNVKDSTKRLVQESILTE